MSDPDISIQEARPEGSSVPHEEPNQPEEILDPNRPETKPNWEKMEYRHLGNSGLRVSVLSYGNWANNDNADLTYESVKLCLENGINFFDTAEVYGLGKGEINLGKAIQKLNIPREKIVVSTKIYRIGDDPNDSFLSRKHIMEGLKNSLKRLQLDYVDILYCHRYDMRTPLEETCKAMNDLIEDEKILYWGTSHWTSCQIMEAIKICNKPKTASNLMMSEIARILNEREEEPETMPFTGKELGELVQLIDKGTISSSIAKKVLEELFVAPKAPSKIIEEKGWVQISDEGAIKEVVNKIIEANPQSVADFKAGKDRALGFLVGQAMKETKGKANPQLLNKLFLEELKK